MSAFTLVPEKVSAELLGGPGLSHPGEVRLMFKDSLDWPD